MKKVYTRLPIASLLFSIGQNPLHILMILSLQCMLVSDMYPCVFGRLLCLCVPYLQCKKTYHDLEKVTMEARQKYIDVETRCGVAVCGRRGRWVCVCVCVCVCPVPLLAKPAVRSVDAALMTTTPNRSFRLPQGLARPGQLEEKGRVLPTACVQK